MTGHGVVSRRYAAAATSSSFENWAYVGCSLTTSTVVPDRMTIASASMSSPAT